MGVMGVHVLSALWGQLHQAAALDTFLVHLFRHLDSLVLVLELEHFSLSLGVLLDVFHALHCPSYHLVLGVFHYLELYLFVS